MGSICSIPTFIQFVFNWFVPSLATGIWTGHRRQLTRTDGNIASKQLALQVVGKTKSDKSCGKLQKHPGTSGTPLEHLGNTRKCPEYVSKASKKHPENGRAGSDFYFQKGIVFKKLNHRNLEIQELHANALRADHFSTYHDVFLQDNLCFLACLFHDWANVILTYS